MSTTNKSSKRSKVLTKFRKRVVVFNKGDRLKDMKYFESIQEKINQPCFLISAREGHNVGNALVQIRNIVTKIREEEAK